MDTAQLLPKDQVAEVVLDELRKAPLVDLHTHLYAPRFGEGFLLRGVDELLTYHYLVAELFRVVPPGALTPDAFYALPKREQADLVWKHLFVERSPLSEACRGVLTTLHAFGLESGPGALSAARAFFAEQDADAHVDRVMELSGVRSITMTNEVFDEAERHKWLTDPELGKDPRFRAVVRLDPLLLATADAKKKLHAWGYGKSLDETRRFLREWLDRTNAAYIAVSLPPDFTYPAAAGDPTFGPGEEMLEHVVLPICRERNLPFAMMIGTRRGVNPALRVAGDALGKADVTAVTNLCSRFPENKFFVTMLSRENQHELCVAARKFGTLMPFGCWWFLNTPLPIEEMTRLRTELLGTSFIPQHSDARVLDQLVYKWDHSRRILGRVLAEKYDDLQSTGWPLTREGIRRDVTRLLRDNYLEFLAR
jgi:hypothetical protein